MVFQSCSLSYTQSFTFGFDRSRDRPIFRQNDVNMDLKENVQALKLQLEGIKHNVKLWENYEVLPHEHQEVLINALYCDVLMLRSYVSDLRKKIEKQGTE